MGKTYSFVDTTTMGARVVAFLKACLFTKFGVVFMNIDRIVAVHNAGEDVVSVSEMDTFLSSIVSSVDSVLWIMTHIYFFIWLYRSAANARAMGRTGFSQSPCWSFVNFLIPAWRLVMPFLFMRDLLRASTNAASDASGDTSAWRRGRLPDGAGARLLAWAGMFLLTALSGYAVAAALIGGSVSLLSPNASPQEIAEAFRMEMMPAWSMTVTSAFGAFAAVAQALQAFFAGWYVGVVTTAQAASRFGGVVPPVVHAPPSDSPAEAAPPDGFGWPDEPVR